jgi:hypothetical protein
MGDLYRTAYQRGDPMLLAERNHRSSIFTSLVILCSFCFNGFLTLYLTLSG